MSSASLTIWSDLVPAAHLVERTGMMGQMYLEALAWKLDCWEDDSLWMDTSRGVFCRGPKGPICNSGFDLNLKAPPLDAELLQEEILIRYLASTNQDREIFNSLSLPDDYSTSQIRAGQPIIVSTLSNKTLAIGSRVWEADKDSCLGEREVLSNGAARFTLKHNQRSLKFTYDLSWWEARDAWLAQASRVFHAHGVPLKGDLSTYKLIIPGDVTATRPSDSKAKRRRRRNCPPIYLFLSTSIFWSFDPNGQTPISDDLCFYLGLPARFLPTCYEQSWPTEIYEMLQVYHTARGFDPTTADLARDIGYSPIYEIVDQPLPSRFEEIDDSASGNAASTVHTSQINCPLRRGAPRASYRKGAKSTDFSEKPLAAASLRQAARQAGSSLKSTSKPILPRSARPSAVPAKPHFSGSTAITKPIELSTRKTSHPQSSLLTGRDKDRTNETPRPREVIAGTKNAAVDTRRRSPTGSSILANGTQKETEKDLNARRPRLTVSRGPPVVPTRKTSAPSATTAKTKIISPLTPPTTTAAAGTMKQSGPAAAQRVESSDVRTRTGTASNVTRPHRANHTATSASAAPRPTIPKSSSSNAVAATASSTRPPSTRLASVGSTKAGGRGAATTMGASSSQATASRSRLGRTSPAQEDNPERRLSSIEERTRMLARTSNDSPNAPSPFVDTTPRRIATRPPLRWR
ncbi:hypothetical protein V5O48_012097 [Marasmius crinis-equi]|uniref:Uncharacterized protein n=1 Tax=Marasmius crinis-equi TaxID=585013 RepID=A0ABR3F3R1_9AGAR